MNARRIGAYPGSFNPPTVAHLAIAEAAVTRHGLHRLDLIVSRDPLGKDRVEIPTLEERIGVLEAVASSRSWLGIRVSDHQLVARLADGYDVVVMGADKWHQIHDPAFYESAGHRDDALAALPVCAVAPRPPFEVPAELILRVDGRIDGISATDARAGRHDVMVPEARASGLWAPPDDA